MEKSEPAEMPRLSTAQAARLVGVITEKAGADPSCEICGQHNWDVPDNLLALQTIGMGDDGVPFPGPVNNSMLFASIICQNCGNTKLINLERIGFMLRASE